MSCELKRLPDDSFRCSCGRWEMMLCAGQTLNADDVERAEQEWASHRRFKASRAETVRRLAILNRKRLKIIKEA